MSVNIDKNNVNFNKNLNTVLDDSRPPKKINNADKDKNNLEQNKEPTTNEPLIQHRNIITSNSTTDDSRKKRSFIFLVSTVILLIILVGVIIILLASYLSVSSKLEKLTLSQKISAANIGNPLYNRLIFSDGKKIRLYDLKTKSTDVLEEVKNDLTTIEAVNDTLYWIEKDTNRIQFFSHVYKNVTLLNKVRPQAFAYEDVTKKFYVVDQSAGTVVVIDPETSLHSLVLSGLDEPNDIAIDVYAGIMFITQYKKSIIRAHLDGSNSTHIISDRKVTSMTIDYMNKKVFWAEEGNGIMTSNYNGENVKFIRGSQTIIYSLAVLDNQLFWLLPSFKKDSASIWTCEIAKEDCKYQKKVPIPFENPQSLMFTRVNYDKIENPCKKNNGDCSDLCLLKPDNLRTCSCRNGFELDSDLKSCKRITEVIIYLDNKHYIRTINLRAKQRDLFKENALIPTLTKQYLWKHTTKNFTYDYINDYLYFADSKDIYQVSIMKNTETKHIKTKSNRQHDYAAVAVDPLNNNFYYFTDTDQSMIIQVIPGGDTPNFSIKRKLSEYWFIKPKYDGYNYGDPCPQFMAIDSNEGYIFFTKCRSYSLKVRLNRMNLDGSNEKKLIEFESERQLETIAIDQVDKKVYYLNEFKNTIFYADYDFNSTIQLKSDKIPIKQVDSMYVYKQYLYISDSTSIWRINKLSGSDATEITSMFQKNEGKKIFGIQIFNITASRSSFESPCLINNGNCTEFCFAKPQKKCMSRSDQAPESKL